MWQNSGIAILDPAGSWICQQWLDRLQHEASAADSLSPLVLELLTLPKAVSCDMQGEAKVRLQLAKAVARLLTSKGSE
jgi:hypothetical protein